MDLADPERALAVSYAPRDVRPALTALFALDERMAQIVAATTEPMIGLMRLAWWREALEKLDRDPAPAEPLLRDIGAQVLPRGATGAQLAGIEDGWAALLDGEPDGDAIARHGRERGRGLFAAAAAILHAGEDRLAVAGEVWALADLAHRHSVETVRAAARARARALWDALDRHTWPKAARPLAALAALAVRDAKGDGPRRQGSPRRLLRMLAMKLTGR